MKLKEQIKHVLDRLPYIRGLKKEIAFLKSNFLFPPGHFYSPIVSTDTIKLKQKSIWDGCKKEGVDGINLNTSEQLRLLANLSGYYTDMPFSDTKQSGLRYYFDNIFYAYTDAIVLYAMMRHFNPRQIIEIGSGFSSSVMLDTNELFLDNRVKLTFIDPYPERLYSVISSSDRQTTTIIKSDVQSISLEEFAKLDSGDFLFIDSSHVVKTGSDVHYILFRILPLLKSGVIVHFHDVFYPFEYPESWVLEGRNWNEDYFLHAFMMYNTTFKILLFSDYIHQVHKEAFAGMPLCYKNFGGNFWMIKNQEQSKELQ
jgi:predicted O-methyltransferase YrrM